MSKLIRTIENAKAEAVLYFVEGDEIITQWRELPKGIKTAKEALKYLRKVGEDDTIKIAYVKSVEVETALYGMEEQAFTAIADVYKSRSDTDFPKGEVVSKDVVRKTARVSCVNPSTKDFIERLYPVKKEESALKEAQKWAKAESLVALSVSEVFEEHTLYACTMARFMENARRMKDATHYAE